MSENTLVPIGAVADKLGVTVPVIRAWVRKGAIPKESYVQVGGTYRFDLPFIMATLLRPDAGVVPQKQEVVKVFELTAFDEDEDTDTDTDIDPDTDY
jgi:hypothetical protein